MLRRLIDLVTAGDADAGPDDLSDDPKSAAAALMVEAALMDERFDEVERARIVTLLEARFEVAPADAEELIETATARVGEANHLFGFTRTVNQHFDQEQRVALMEMLWQVAYADGELDDYEANLMRRIAGLIHVSDRENGAARKRALEALGSEA